MIAAWLSFIIIIGLVMALSKYELGIVLTLGAIGFAILAGVNIIPLSEKILKETVKRFVPKKALDVNIKAFEVGFKIGKEYKKK